MLILFTTIRCIFSLSFIPFCYIYAIMIVYKLYAHHRMALFISFALSLTVIPVLWLVSKFAPGLLWYSYLIAYIIEIVAILVTDKLYHIGYKSIEIIFFIPELIYYSQ